MLYRGPGKRDRVRVGLELFAILIKVREGLTEKGIPEGKNLGGRRELHGLLRVVQAEGLCKGPEAGVCLVCTGANVVSNWTGGGIQVK